MPGWNNGVSYGQAFQITPSDAEDIDLAQRGSADNVSILNYSGNPEGLVSANPSSLSHDRTNGDIYYKQSGTGNTGWIKLNNPNNPFSTLQLYDDFLGTVGSGAGNTNLVELTGNGGTVLGISSDDEHPGVYELSCGTSSSSGRAGIATNSLVVGNGQCTVTWTFKLDQLSEAANRFFVRCGLGNFSTTTFSGTEGCWFEYIDNANSGNWVTKSANGGSVTTENTNSAVDTDWHTLKVIVNAAGTEAAFYIDNIAVNTSPITTNIPTGSVVAFLQIAKSVNTNTATLQADLFTMTYALTVGRAI